MQHLGVNLGCILRFELGLFICFFVFCLRNLGWFWKSSGNTADHRKLTPCALYA